jgi:ribosomal protein S18 acetylase RimI-like enzyme
MKAFIREAFESDAETIARVDVESRRGAYRDILPDAFLQSLSVEKQREKWSERLQDLSTFVLIAQNESAEALGYAYGGRTEKYEPEYAAEIFAIYVLPSHQQRGIGRTLMKSSAERLFSKGIDSLLIWVLAENPARKFYEALGGVFLRSAPAHIAGLTMERVAYGWKDTSILRVP